MRIYHSTHSPIDIKTLRTATNKYHKLISLAKHTYNSNLILSSIFNLDLLWKSINALLHCNHLWFLPSTKSIASFPQLFATYFFDKVFNCHTNLHYFHYSCSFSPNIYRSRIPHLRTCLSKCNIHSYLTML